MGGTKRPETNYTSNLMALCGSGTSGCHGYLESHRDEAILYGFIVPQYEMPSKVAVKTYIHGWVLLNDEGTFTSTLEPLKGQVMDERLLTAMSITDSINDLECKIEVMRTERKKLLIELRQDKVTVRLLSDCLGMSEQNVHKIVKGR